MEIVNLVNDKCQVIDSSTGQIMFEGSYDDCESPIEEVHIDINDIQYNF
jgi:hypothetical protein